MKTITLEKFLLDKNKIPGFKNYIDQCAKVELYIDTTELAKIIEKARWGISIGLIQGKVDKFPTDYANKIAEMIAEYPEVIIKCTSTK